MKRHLVEQYREIWKHLEISEQVVKDRGLPLFEQVEELCIAEVPSSGQAFYLTPAATGAWKAMKSAAAQEGVEITIHSAFRDIDRQRTSIENKLKAGRLIDDILTRTAPPGCSEHHTGRAVDISMGEVDELDQDFALTPAYSWLCKNAKQYGFTLSFPQGNAFGYIFEPWHWFFSEGDFSCS